MNGALMTMPELKPRLPRADLSVTHEQIKTGDWDDHYRPERWSVAAPAAIWCVPQKQHVLQFAIPLLIRVRKEEEFFFAENETLQIVGIGTSTNEAMENFVVHLLHFHQYYARLPSNKVIGEGKRLKQLYSRLFV